MFFNENSIRYPIVYKHKTFNKKVYVVTIQDLEMSKPNKRNIIISPSKFVLNEEEVEVVL